MPDKKISKASNLKAFDYHRNYKLKLYEIEPGKVFIQYLAVVYIKPLIQQRGINIPEINLVF